MKTPSFWYRPDLSAAAFALSPISWLYRLGDKINRAGVKAQRAAVPVICVGNIVAGGTGKTPVVIDLAQRLAARGIAVHCLTRGYGGAEPGPLRVDATIHNAANVGDEALLLAAHAPTWVAKDRVAGARSASQGGAQVLVMDDGFQNPSLHKDISLVVVDGAVGFGNQHLIPAGPLREPIATGMERADAVVVIGADDKNSGAYAGSKPVLNAVFVPGPEQEQLVGKRVIAFAGLGRPDKFFDAVRMLDCDVIATQAFADHHPYTKAELTALEARAKTEDALLVTTEKDAVRLPADFRKPIHVLSASLQWADTGPLDALLDRLMP